MTRIIFVAANEKEVLKSAFEVLVGWDQILVLEQR
jgi:hypothetical protein